MNVLYWEQSWVFNSRTADGWKGLRNLILIYINLSNIPNFPLTCDRLASCEFFQESERQKIKIKRIRQTLDSWADPRYLAALRHISPPPLCSYQGLSVSTDPTLSYISLCQGLSVSMPPHPIPRPYTHLDTHTRRLPQLIGLSEQWHCRVEPRDSPVMSAPWHAWFTRFHADHDIILAKRSGRSDPNEYQKETIRWMNVTWFRVNRPVFGVKISHPAQEPRAHSQRGQGTL